MESEDRERRELPTKALIPVAFNSEKLLKARDLVKKR